MIQHFSKRLPPPSTIDPRETFPQSGIEAICIVDDREIEIAASPDRSTWLIKHGKNAVSGPIGFETAYTDLVVESWTLDRARPLVEFVGGMPALMRCVLGPEKADRFLTELGRIRDADAGVGPFPIDLYRAPENIRGDRGGDDFPEELDVLQRLHVDPEDPVILRATFPSLQDAQVIIASGGSAVSISGAEIVETGRFWDSLRFSGRGNDRSANQGPGQIPRRKVA